MRARLPLIALLALPVAANAQSFEVQPSPEKPALLIGVTETINATPDSANVGVGVQTVAPTAVSAMAQNATKMERVIATLKARGIAEKDIQTTGISLNAEYNYQAVSPGGTPAFIGYRVSNSVRVTTNDIVKLGSLLDAMVAAGGTNIDGPYFFIKDNRILLKEARDKALASADVQAKEYAARAGFARARLVMISEGTSYSQPLGVYAVAEAAPRAVSAAPPPPPPVAPGQVATGVSITVRYQLEK